MTINLNQAPLEMLRMLVSCGLSYNSLCRVTKGLNELLSKDLEKIKFIFDKLIHLQQFYTYKKQYWEKPPFIFSERVIVGGFHKDGLELVACTENENSNIGIFSIRADLGPTETSLLSEDNPNKGIMYYLNPVTENAVHTYNASILKIHVARNEALNPEQHFFVEQAEKFANIFYKPKEVDPSSVFSYSSVLW